MSLWCDGYRKETLWPWLSVYPPIYLPAHLSPVSCLCCWFTYLSPLVALSPLMYFQKAIISHPSLSFAMINKTSSFMPSLQEQFSPFHPGACSTHAQVRILKHEWTDFPDNISPIVLANSMNIFPFLKRTSFTWFILKLLVLLLAFVTLFLWLHPAAD